MPSHFNRAIGSMIGIGLMSGALIWGGNSFTSSQAFDGPSAAAVPVVATAPTNGFTDVAKQVTPAVVNITTVMTEKVSDGPSVPDELRDRMEEFFGKPFGPRGRDHPTLLNIEGLGEDKGRASSFLRMDIS